jgi:acyl dehydratase
MPERAMRWTVEARNTAADSENKIHDDEVARRYGFAGGLVPGITTYAWLARQALVALGPQWLERGTIEVRFLQPVYEGDRVLVEAVPAGRGDGRAPATRGSGGPGGTGGAELGARAVDLTARGPDGATAARGGATLPAVASTPPDVAAYPSAPLPDPPAPVSAEVLRGLGSLGVLAAGFRAERAGEYLGPVGDDLAHWREDGVAHPGWLLQFANWILAANVRLGPWIHTGSAVTFYRPVRDGERFEVRGRVAEVYERKGHGLVDLDLLYVVGDEAVQRVRHTAIHRIRPA